MKTILEDLGRKIGETAEIITNKAGEAVEVQRLRNQIRTLEHGNERDFMELGRKIYEHHASGEVVDADAIAICEAIQSREESIEKYEQQISDVKGDVKCEGCGKSIDKEMAYCPNCGAKAPEPAPEPAQEEKTEECECECECESGECECDSKDCDCQEGECGCKADESEPKEEVSEEAAPEKVAEDVVTEV